MQKEIGPPKFVTQVAFKIEISEGQNAYFEARLTSTKHPNMKIEWFKNGKPLLTRHRCHNFHDFEIVILDIMYCYAEDSGTYKYKATNKYISDTNKGSVICFEKSGLILTSQVPRKIREQTLQQIQNLNPTK